MRRKGVKLTNLDKALSEISAIRSQIARGSEFRGYGPASVAASGVFALLVAALQARWPASLDHDFSSYSTVWIATAAISLILAGIDTVLRAKRVHSSLANEMIYHAAARFLPALTAGLLLTAVITRFAPHRVGMLPGLWQVIFSLGIFASCEFLPRRMFLVGMWYLAAGLICLASGADDGGFSPWAMGLPFGIGQLLVAAVLQFGYRGKHNHE